MATPNRRTPGFFTILRIELAKAAYIAASTAYVQAVARTKFSNTAANRAAEQAALKRKNDAMVHLLSLQPDYFGGTISVPAIGPKQSSGSPPNGILPLGNLFGDLS